MDVCYTLTRLTMASCCLSRTFVAFHLTYKCSCCFSLQKDSAGCCVSHARAAKCLPFHLLGNNALCCSVLLIRNSASCCLFLCYIPVHFAVNCKATMSACHLIDSNVGHCQHGLQPRWPPVGSPGRCPRVEPGSLGLGKVQSGH